MSEFYGFEVVLTKDAFQRWHGEQLYNLNRCKSRLLCFIADRIVTFDGIVLKDRNIDGYGVCHLPGWSENAIRVEWPSCKLDRELTDPTAKERYAQMVREARVLPIRQEYLRKLQAGT